MVDKDCIGWNAIAKSQQISVCRKTEVNLIIREERHQTCIAPCDGMFSIIPHSPQSRFYLFSRTANADPCLAVPPVSAELTIGVWRQPVWSIRITLHCNHILFAKEASVARYENVWRGIRHDNRCCSVGCIWTVGPMALSKPVGRLLRPVFLLILLQEQSFVIRQY